MPNNTEMLGKRNTGGLHWWNKMLKLGKSPRSCTHSKLPFIKTPQIHYNNLGNAVGCIHTNDKFTSRQISSQSYTVIQMRQYRLQLLSLYITTHRNYKIISYTNACIMVQKMQ